MTFHGGGLLPLLILGSTFVAISIGCYLAYIFYSASILEFVSLPSFTSSTLQIISISISVFFLLIGVLLIFLDSETMMVISKSSGRILFQKKRLLGKTKAEDIEDINDVLRVELRQEYKMEKVTLYRWPPIGPLLRQPFIQPKAVLYRQAIIVFKDGRELLLARERTLGSIMLDSEGELSIASQVASFLGIAYEEINRGPARIDASISEGEIRP
jgi:ABC-type antimicrobial peptide transport system permease subunit